MPRIVKVESFSRKGLYHTVRQLSDGNWHCDCEYFNYRGYKEGFCDHILKFRHLRLKHHGYKHKAEIKKIKAIKKHNHMCRRYQTKERKLLNCRLSQVKTIEKLYFDLENLRIKIKKNFKEVR